MSDEKSQQEPSMEDILASIRRILSEDDAEEAAKAPPPPPPPAPPPVKAAPPPTKAPEPEPEPMDDFGAFEMEPEPAPSFGADPEDILELTDDMVADEEPAFEDTMSFEPEPAPQMEMPSYEPEEVMEMDDDESILAPPVQAASSSALAELATAVARERAIALGRGGVTLEEIVREILKALVKEWLDQNLASMTEKMVKKEIDMVAKRAEKK